MIKGVNKNICLCGFESATLFSAVIAIVAKQSSAVCFRKFQKPRLLRPPAAPSQ
jgi:hypothetical protein